mmetsp:Transcript_10517/g.31076  ORF Transcript_10517/g.31076 Transcript_10517/m.31076 type:complete len:418 (-) Transcript_10517:71-1324(-)
MTATVAMSTVMRNGEARSEARHVARRGMRSPAAGAKPRCRQPSRRRKPQDRVLLGRALNLFRALHLFQLHLELLDVDRLALRLLVRLQGAHGDVHAPARAPARRRVELGGRLARVRRRGDPLAAGAVVHREPLARAALDAPAPGPDGSDDTGLPERPDSHVVADAVDCVGHSGGSEASALGAGRRSGAGRLGAGGGVAKGHPLRKGEGRQRGRLGARARERHKAHLVGRGEGGRLDQPGKQDVAANLCLPVAARNRAGGPRADGGLIRVRIEQQPLRHVFGLVTHARVDVRAMGVRPRHHEESNEPTSRELAEPRRRENSGRAAHSAGAALVEDHRRLSERARDLAAANADGQPVTVEHGAPRSRATGVPPVAGLNGRRDKLGESAAHRVASGELLVVQSRVGETTDQSRPPRLHAP